MCQPGWEGGALGKNGYGCTCGWVLLLLTWNCPNIVHRLYPKTKSYKKLNWFSRRASKMKSGTQMCFIHFKANWDFNSCFKIKFPFLHYVNLKYIHPSACVQLPVCKLGNQKFLSEQPVVRSSWCSLPVGPGSFWSREISPCGTESRVRGRWAWGAGSLVQSSWGCRYRTPVRAGSLGTRLRPHLPSFCFQTAGGLLCPPLLGHHRLRKSWSPDVLAIPPRAGVSFLRAKCPPRFPTKLFPESMSAD